MQYQLDGVGILTSSIAGNVGIKMVHIEGVEINSSLLKMIKLMVGHWG